MSEERFKYLTEYVTAEVTRRLTVDKGMSLAEALSAFLNSETFEKLSHIDTGLYVESPAYVYSLLQEEWKRGTLRSQGA